MDRPKRSDDSIAKAAAEDLLPELMGWAEAGESERESYLADAVQIMHDAELKNGYALARDLERKGYESDARLVEILDGAFGLLLNRHRRAVREWVKGWNISVPWTIGQRALVKNGSKEFIGEITAINVDDATCVVTVTELGHAKGSGFVINSEDVVLHEELVTSGV